MGQQQLLLIVLGIIIVGLAIFVGVSLFKANAIESKRAIITNELVNLSAMAQQYYQRPSALGGGGRKFTGWTVPSELKTTAAGHYTEQVNQDKIIITGIGNEVVTGSDSLEIQIEVNPTTFKTTIVH